MFIFAKPTFLQMIKKITSFILFLFTIFSYSQGEANIWYFGKNAGLDFNSGIPVALTDGKLDTLEGCATISNSSGQLLFYTDGITVYNKKHEVMPNGNGLLGNPSSSQSAIAVPKPNSSTIYYIFTSDSYEQNNANGVNFTEVDLSLNGGLGDVTTHKNVPLLKPACEKIAVIKNDNEDEYWVVIHERGSNRFLAYNISLTGVNTNPVISSVGAQIPDDRDFTLGYLKFSLDGKKIISCNSNLNAELFDFNTITGTLSNPKTINNKIFNYGVEFSPSGEIAYISTWYNDLYQYDLTATDIASTEVVLRSSYDQNNRVGALQLANDGKIYVANFSSTHISVIEKPDILGLNCNFQYEKINLGTGTYSLLGLPQFIQSYFNAGIMVQNTCIGETSNFSLNSNKVITAPSWDFGDGNTSTEISPTHLYASPGTYNVSVTATSEGGSVTKIKNVVISSIPTATQPQNMLICDDNNDGFYTFDLTQQNTAILNGQDSDLYTVNYFANNTAIVSPQSYTNTIAYQSELITAEVSNKANSTCKSSTNFTINVFDTPKPNALIANMNLCDNTSVGTDTDGKVKFDLTQQATAILNGQLASQYLITYYKDAALLQEITVPAIYENTNASETIYVKVANKDHADCYSKSSFKLEVFPLPITKTTVDLKQCDDNIDGFSVFNLEQAITKITNNAINEIISFHKTLIDAQNNSNSITTPTTYTNQIVNQDKVYARVINNNGCLRITQLNLIVSTTEIPMSFSKTFVQCDDAILGTNTDGVASFDLSEATNDIRSIFPVGQLLDITYYQTIKDALAEKNQITNLSNYRNTVSPHKQNIYVRVDSQVNNDCLGLGSYITLKVESIPVIKPITKIKCDDDQDGLFAFDTTTLENELLNGLTNVSVSYFDEKNIPLPSPLPNPFTTASQKIKVSVKNNTATGCSFDSTITFVVDDMPEIFPIDLALTTVCDDETDPIKQDGKYAFDTSSFQSILLGNQTGMQVNYYDAYNAPLPSPLPNPFITSTQTIKVEVVNPKNATCTATSNITFTIHQVPKISLLGNELVCSNLPTFTKQIDAGLFDLNSIDNYNYIWFLDGDLITNETNYNLTVNKKGIYTVEVSDKLTGCSNRRNITVNASDIASNIISTVDESNTIKISVTGNGDYEYALDDQNGFFQNDNTFQNIPSGIHTVYVKDKNGCGTATNEVAVFGIPAFFTPNQDGYNDYWNVEGIIKNSNTTTTIQIFDRYGKLIKQISPFDIGWDGTYIGMQMPSDDYWYVIKLQDNRIFKGHFALKR
jgi:gliding motility-associated-like protein